VLLASVYTVASLKETNEMVQIFDVKIKSNIQPKQQSFLLDAKAIKLSSRKERSLDFNEKEFVEPNELGLYLGKTLDSENIDAVHHRYIRNEKNRAWIPYAYCGEWKGMFNPNGTSIITNQLKRSSVSKTETPLITIEFQYDKDWEIISEKELNLIVSWLNENSQKRRNIKTALKNTIKQAETNYTNAKNLLDQTKNKKLNNEKATRETEQKIKQGDDNLKQLQDLLTKAQEELAKAQGAVFDSDKIQQALNNQLILLGKQINREKIAKTQIIVPSPQTINLEIQNLQNIIALPDVAPGRFRDEFDLMDVQSIKDAYNTCNRDMNSIDACKANLDQYRSSKVTRRYMRRLF